MMQQNPSRSMMVMGTAPDAARYSIAPFRSGVRASIADSAIRGRRQNRRLVAKKQSALPHLNLKFNLMVSADCEPTSNFTHSLF